MINWFKMDANRDYGRKVRFDYPEMILGSMPSGRRITGTGILTDTCVMADGVYCGIVETKDSRLTIKLENLDYEGFKIPFLN